MQYSVTNTYNKYKYYWNEFKKTPQKYEIFWLYKTIIVFSKATHFKTCKFSVRAVKYPKTYAGYKYEWLILSVIWNVNDTNNKDTKHQRHQTSKTYILHFMKFEKHELWKTAATHCLLWAKQNRMIDTLTNSAQTAK